MKAVFLLPSHNCPEMKRNSKLGGTNSRRRQHRYSDELQPRKIQKSRCCRKRFCSYQCCFFSLVIVSSFLFVVLVLNPLIKDKLRCIYYDTGSEDLGYPNFYLNCGANKEDCQFFGYEYHSSKKSTKCCRGDTVDLHLCVYPQDNPVVPKPTPVNQLQYLSWNVFERPLYISQDGQVERVCYIPRWIAANVPKADVVVFQELFSEGCWGDRSSMKEMLKVHGYHYSARPVEDINHLYSAGVFLASKWPIEQQDSLVFGYVNIMSVGKYIRPKGAVYAKIRKTVGKDEQVYHLFGLHLHANKGDLNTNVRQGQVKELVKFIESKNISQSEPVLLAGDFNIAYDGQTKERETIFEMLSAVLPKNISKLGYTSDRLKNKLNFDTNYADYPNEWIDYVLYMSSHRVPKSATMNTIPAKAAEPIFTCFCANCPNFGVHHIPNKADCRTVRNYTDLSDHYPVLGDFTF